MIRYLSLFSGIGAFEKALDNLGIPYELLAYCEVDKYASKAYSLLHHVPENMNLGDITKVDEKALPTDIDLLTYGFPCQDISIAGNKRGFVNEDGTKTRSGLFFDALRIIEHCKPKVAIAENVKNLTSKSMSSIFTIVLESLDNAGYNCYWQVLNSADYELLAMNGISKTQIYKMAGNSIVVTVLEHLFKQIYTPGTQSIDSLKKKSLDILNTL